MKYICLVYNQPEKLSALSDDEFEAHVGEVGRWVGELEAAGRHIYSAGLQSTRSAATVRVRGGATQVTDGPFAETKEVLGGFTIIEARDLSDAVKTASRLDVARIGSVEVRPLMDFDSEMSDPHDRRVASAIKRRAGA